MKKSNLKIDTVTLTEFKKFARKDPKYRKAEYDMQWDMPFITSNLVLQLFLSQPLSQKQLARKMGTKQPALSRAESHGCGLDFLNKLAKACGKRLIIKVEKPLKWRK